MQSIITIKKFLLLLGDAAFLLLALPLTLAVAFGAGFGRDIFFAHLVPFLAIYTFILILFFITGLYDIRSFKSTTSTFATILIIHGVGTISGILFFYLATDPAITPKTNLAINMVLAAGLVSLWRMLFHRFLARHMQINVAIAGLNEHARELADVMAARPYMGYKLAAIICTEPILGESMFNDTKIYFADKDLVKNLRASNIDTVITAENPHLNPTIAQAFYECIPYKIRFLDLAQSYELLTGRIPISYVNQTWFLENINEHQKKVYDNLKRAADVAAAILILALSLPLWPLIAFLIKWESAGPVFYKQERVGKDKKLFGLLKFRSMIQNAESGTAVWAQEKDKRVTKTGAFLRRAHLDELPQMINIVMGDIGLVGPRPERIEFVRELEKEIPHYNIRHITKPGFTGWAQINFRYARTPMDTYEKFQYDLYYLKNRSLVLDISILLKTVNLFFRL
jgi:exopolysaccharide biosynthesis polyprenyl glycosylphosphotransferase